MLVFSQFQPQVGDVQEEVMVIMVGKTHTAHHIAEAQPAVIQSVTKA